MAKNIFEVAAFIGLISLITTSPSSAEQSYKNMIFDLINIDRFVEKIMEYAITLDFKEINASMSMLDIVFKQLQEKCDGKCYELSGTCDPRNYYCDGVQNNYADCTKLCSRSAGKYEDPQNSCRNYCQVFLLWKQLGKVRAEKKKEYSSLPSTTSLPSNDYKIWMGIAIASWCITLLIVLGFIIKNFNKELRSFLFGGKEVVDNADPVVGRDDGIVHIDVENQPQIKDEPPARVDDGENEPLLPIAQEVVAGDDDRPVRQEVVPLQPEETESHEPRPLQRVVQESGGDGGSLANPHQPVGTPGENTIPKQSEQRQHNPDTCMQTDTSREGHNMRPTEDNGQPAYGYLRHQTAQYGPRNREGNIPFSPSMTANFNGTPGYPENACHYQDNNDDSGLGTGPEQSMKELQHARLSAEGKKLCVIDESSI